MKKILFVCLGNICRSPGAEAIMKAKVKEAGKENEFFIDSAGLYSGHADLYRMNGCVGMLHEEDIHWIVVHVLFIPQLILLILI